jgi:hypothetical protein
MFEDRSKESFARQFPIPTVGIVDGGRWIRSWQSPGRTNEELAATGEVRKDHAARAKVAKARKAFLPTFAAE